MWTWALQHTASSAISSKRCKRVMETTWRLWVSSCVTSKVLGRVTVGWSLGGTAGVTLPAAHLVNSSNYGRLVSLMMMIRGVLKGLQRAKCAALAAAESAGASGTWWRASARVSRGNAHTHKQARTNANTPTGLTSCLLSWLILIWTRANEGTGWMKAGDGQGGSRRGVGSIHMHTLPTHTQGANWINNTYLLTSNLISYANQLR